MAKHSFALPVKSIVLELAIVLPVVPQCVTIQRKLEFVRTRIVASNLQEQIGNTVRLLVFQSKKLNIRKK